MSWAGGAADVETSVTGSEATGALEGASVPGTGATGVSGVAPLVAAGTAVSLKGSSGDGTSLVGSESDEDLSVGSGDGVNEGAGASGISISLTGRAAVGGWVSSAAPAGAAEGVVTAGVGIGGGGMDVAGTEAGPVTSVAEVEVAT
jgi:hypothetical protein